MSSIKLMNPGRLNVVPDMPSSTYSRVFLQPISAAAFFRIFLWFVIEFDSPCNSSSRDKRIYKAATPKTLFLLLIFAPPLRAVAA
jgi:hypothetical protein